VKLSISSRRKTTVACATVLGIWLTGASSANAPTPHSQAGTEQRRAGTGVYPATEPDDNTGFVPIFDGKSLAGWDGDPRFWRIEQGEIVGETTPTNVVTQNNFLIWRGGKVRDFELKLEFRMNGTNSGIQYRSTELPDVGKWVLRGYQADMDFTQNYLGNVHDERGRGVLSRRGEVTRIVDGPTFKVVGTIADSTLLRGVMNVDGWNQYHIIARGPVLLQFINRQLMSVAIDEDSKNVSVEGVIGFQMHVGPPFKIQFRNVLYRRL
jgi:3-keto-disaccharide hydrolase